MLSLHKPSLAYAAASGAMEIMNSLVFFYYVKVYVDIYGISSTWFQVAQVVYMIWNTLNDPWFAYIQDNSDWHGIKVRRKIILHGGPFFVLAFLSFWLPYGHYGKESSYIGMHLIMALVLYDTMYTWCGLGMCCIFTETSMQPEDRVRIVQYSEAAHAIGGLAVTVCSSLSNGLEDYRAFQYCTLVGGVLALLLFLYCGKNAETTSQEPKTPTAEPTESYWRTIGQILFKKDFLILVSVNCVNLVHWTYLQNSTAMVIDVVSGDSGVISAYKSVFLGLLNVLPRIAVVFCTPIINQYSTERVVLWASAVKIPLGLAMFFFYKALGVAPFLLVLMDGVLAYGIFSIIGVPLAFLVDADSARYKRKKPLTSTVFGLNGLCTKPAQSLAPMITMAVYNAWGYSESAGKTSPQLATAMVGYGALVPVVCGIVQVLLWRKFSRLHAQA